MKRLFSAHHRQNPSSPWMSYTVVICPYGSLPCIDGSTAVSLILEELHTGTSLTYCLVLASSMDGQAHVSAARAIRSPVAGIFSYTRSAPQYIPGGATIWKVFFLDKKKGISKTGQEDQHHMAQKHSDGNRSHIGLTCAPRYLSLQIREIAARTAVSRIIETVSFKSAASRA